MASASATISPPPVSPAFSSAISVSSSELKRQPAIGSAANERVRKKYAVGKRLGEGAYAIVYAGHHVDDPDRKVAIKQTKPNTAFKDGISLDVIREIRTLQELRHKYIVGLYDVFSTENQTINMVIEYLPLGDLDQLIHATDTVHYGVADIKAWMNMLCQAIYFCHLNNILHRDVKPSNLLIASDGAVKLADFGLAREMSDPYGRMTYNVITRWYRPPELFMRARHYGYAVDIWSVGTVFSELIIRGPFLPGATDLNQIEVITQAIGMPSEANWPGVTSLEGFEAYKGVAKGVSNPQSLPLKTAFAGRFAAVGPSGIDLLAAMLDLNPQKRISSRAVLEHDWWRANPRPTSVDMLPTPAPKK